MKKQLLLVACTAIAVLTHQNIYSQAWSTTGNAGTSPASNFLGTTDNKALVIRTNNIERMRVNANGTIGVGIKTAPIAALDLRNSTQINSFYVTNSSTNSNQWGVRAYVNGINSSAFRTGGEFSVSGAGSNNTGVNVSASAANVNYGGSLSATDGATSNIGVWGYAGGPSGSTNYAVYGSITGFSAGRDYAGYFAGKTYVKNELIVGTSETPYSASISINSPSTIGTGVYSVNTNTYGNGVYSSYAGSPYAFYAIYAVAPSSGSNMAGYFSGNVTVVGTFSNPSDERLKDNIKPLDNVMDKIMQLDVNTYNFKKEYHHMNLPQVKQYGFIAQNLQKLFPELVQTVADKSKGENNLFAYKTVNYLGMIPVLAKALQEEHTQRIKTEEQLQTLKERVDAMEKALSQAAVSSPALKGLGTSTARLEQNVPNPANQAATINCYIPSGAKSAMLVIYASNGAKVKEFNNLATGANRLEVKANTLGSGVYTYALLIDGKQADSRQMIVAK